MKQVPTAEEFIISTELVVKFDNKQGCILEEELPTLFIEFAKLHVEAMMKEMEQKLLDTLDDMNYLEENVCGVIEEIREYKPDNIK
jgi:hypothetical protein